MTGHSLPTSVYCCQLPMDTSVTCNRGWSVWFTVGLHTVLLSLAHEMNHFTNLKTVHSIPLSFPLLPLPSHSCPSPHLTLHQIKLIMRQYAQAVSEMNRLCFLQVVATTTQCTPDVLSLMEAYAKGGQTAYHTLVSCAIESAVVRRTKIVSSYSVSLYVRL